MFDPLAFFLVFPALITKSDSGQDSSSPSSTPHTRGFSSPPTTPHTRPAPTPQGPPTLALAQPLSQPLVQPVVQPLFQPMFQPMFQPLFQPMVQPLIQPSIQPLLQPQPPPRVPPTPSSHAHLVSPFPLSTTDVLAQGLTSAPPSAPTHPGLLPVPMLQSSPALIKVRKWRTHYWNAQAHSYVIVPTSDLCCSNSKERARRGKQTPPPPPPTTSSVNHLPSPPRLGPVETAFVRWSNPNETRRSRTLSITWWPVWRREGCPPRIVRSSCVPVRASSERCCPRNTQRTPGPSTSLSMLKLLASTTTTTSSSTPWISAPSRWFYSDWKQEYEMIVIILNY